MELHKDFKELLELFNKHNVEYALVGAYALAFYGAPRFTGDIDILVAPKPDNAKKILAALAEFGFSSLGLEENDFTMPGQIIQLGRAPVRVDLLTSISGVGWEKIIASRMKAQFGSLPVFVISKQDFIANKKASGRNKDLADIEAIDEN